MTAKFNPNLEVNLNQKDNDDKVFVSFNANLVPPSAQPTFPLHWNFLDGETNKVMKPLMPLGPGEAVYFPSKQKPASINATVNTKENLWSCSEICLVVQKVKEKVSIDVINESLPNKSLLEIQQLIDIL